MPEGMTAGETFDQGARNVDALVFVQVDFSYRVRGIPRRVLRDVSFRI